MNTFDEQNKLRHPYYKIMDLPKSELTTKVASMSREEIIDWLSWNDPNGVYHDEQSIAELGRPVTKPEAEEIMLRQILDA